MKRVAKFEKGGDVEMTAAERRRQNIQRINQRRATNRDQAAVRSEIERFNERLRQGTLTADDMRRMGVEAPQRPAAPAPSMRDAVRPAQPGEAPRRPADAMRDVVRPVGPPAGRPAPRGPGIARVAGAAAAGAAAMEAYNAYRNRPITGAFDRSMDPEGSNEAADAERERQASQPVPARPAQRSRPRMSEADRLNQAELERIARIRSVMEGGDIQPEQPGFFERMGIRRTNETGEGAPSTGSLRGDLQALGRSLGFKKGGAIKGKGMHMMPDGSMMKNKDHVAMKKGGKAMMYREGGKVRQGIQSPKAQEARAEMAEDVMKRSMPAELRRRMRDMMSPEEGREYDAPLTPQERERMRASGFKKGGMIKPKTAMKKGGAVKAPAKKMAHGGKVAAPKKMMMGGMTSKPKKMMGGGRAMYAKGGMVMGRK